MTFKEKLAQEHPQRINQNAMGGCDGCPCEYGYEKENRDCNCSSDLGCKECWNREMPDTPATMTAEEAWVLAKKIVLPTSNGGAFKASELREIFDSDIESYILKNNTPQEAKAKIEAWESKQIRVGDVVTEGSSHEYIVIATSKEMPNGQPLLRSLYDHNLVVFGSDKVIKKTGKHIDILSVLNQIGEEE